MALLDHFHPPLSTRRHWHAFHNAWASRIAADLNQRLPEGYFAEPNVQFGVEIDVATFEENLSDKNLSDEPIAVIAGHWVVPDPVQTVPFRLATDVVEVLVIDTAEEPNLVGAVELIGPGNKTRQPHRNAFVAKCETYLQQGIGLVIVDIVTNRVANLHHKLLKRLGVSKNSSAGLEHLYATAYHVIERHEQPDLDIWNEILAVGHQLPTLPLWLRGFTAVPLDLNATYLQTCYEQRIPVN